MGIIIIRDQEYWLDLQAGPEGTGARIWEIPESGKWADRQILLAIGTAFQHPKDRPNNRIGYRVAFSRCLDAFNRQLMKDWNGDFKAGTLLSRAERRDCWEQFFKRDGRKPVELGSTGLEEWWAKRFLAAVIEAQKARLVTTGVTTG